MQTRYEVKMNGAALSALDESIYITDIQEEAPRMDVSTIGRAGADGQTMTAERRLSLSVRVTFAIRAYDTARRKEVLGLVHAWCTGGGALEISDRPGQSLDVVCTTLPTATSSLRWTEDIVMVFTAYERPYFVSAAPSSGTVTGTGGTVALTPQGTARECVLEATVTNASSENLDWVLITCGTQRMRFAGLALAPGDTLRMEISRGILMLPVAYRTADSADEIRLTQRAINNVSISADKEISATLSARGVWL